MARCCSIRNSASSLSKWSRHWWTNLSGNWCSVFVNGRPGPPNVTFIDSTANYSQSAPATAVNANGSLTLPNKVFSSTLYGVSKKAFNATLYYEDKKFSARASVSRRSVGEKPRNS